MSIKETKRRLPAEWEPQDGVLLCWPHRQSDWGPFLAEVEPVFTSIATEISRYQRVLIACAESLPVRSLLREAGACLDRIRLLELPANDTWARDFGPITVLEGGRPVLLDFGFNGWGLKFAADQDNRVNRRLEKLQAFAAGRVGCGLILEGGSIESDGQGTLLTTSECLLDANRNPHLDRQGLEAELTRQLGADHILWLDHGYLAGDDTDSHIDTLARLAPDDTIVYITCDDAQDEHHDSLAAMAGQLEAFRTPAGAPYRLLPLPWPRPCFGQDGQRLPATYANFLVINGAVLVPTYGDPADGMALDVIGRAFPGRDIIGIDCRSLILQHGSLHCVTMQLPKGVLP